ncbi:hypothetical protein [Aureibacillus halotolerans]|uniref:Uncharacterized protein n=1 Tax=Aureibacillus halotolerans TaxID=1508390 RepID=A0A4V3D5N3_9BACI|nr:hypothetical protein [Aureibacillus halotolerans]TDQ40707.1 hypothetical protein EV213_10553 [Aureibacillus halotolerans]
MKKKHFVLIGLVLLLAVVFGPKVYEAIENHIYQKNHVGAVMVSLYITIHDKYVEDGEYFIELLLGDEVTKYYNLENPIRAYRAENAEVYHAIDLSRLEDYPGVTLRSSVHVDNLTEQEEKILKEDPFFIISSQKYSKYVEVISVSDSLEQEKSRNQ